MKVALFLEEAGLPYEAIPVDTRKGEQHLPAFTALNPNAKVPVIVDDTTTGFDSSAILLYLADKTGQFLPAPQDRGALLSWMMFVASGIGPLGDIEGLLQPNLSVAVLRRGTASATVVVGDGPSVLSMKLQRGDRHQRLQRFTPGEVVAGAPVTITLDADELAAAAAALAAPEKAK
jgi:hypothetical protein